MPEYSRDFERRLIDLESKISFQESELLDMSEAVMNQDVRIERLEATVRALREKMKEVAGEGQPPLPANERPPHY
jgi:SlyX protein